jgi:type I restriction enzyme, S subunit
VNRVSVLSDVCEIVMGQAPDGVSYNTEGKGWPLISGAGDFGEEYPLPKKFTTKPSKVSRAGDIILGIRASIGDRVVSDGEYCLGRGVAALRPHRELDPRFLWHWLEAIRPILAAKGNGATFKQVARDDVARLPIDLPPLTEQRRVAALLDRADMLRTKRRQALAHLDDLGHVVFIDLFGDPVTNPRRWSNPSLGNLLTFQQYGPRFYNEAYSAEGVRIIRITDLNEAGDLDFTAMPRLAVTSEERRKYALQAGDLIFARTGATVGKVALIRPSDPVCIAGAYFITMRFDVSVEPVYVRAVLTSPSIRAIVAKQSRQAAQQNFSGPALRRLPMPVPPQDLQRRFVEIVNTIDKLRSTQRDSLVQLNALFSSLQGRAFQGEL